MKVCCRLSERNIQLPIYNIRKFLQHFIVMIQIFICLVECDTDQFKYYCTRLNLAAMKLKARSRININYFFSTDSNNSLSPM